MPFWILFFLLVVTIILLWQFGIFNKCNHQSSCFNRGNQGSWPGRENDYQQQPGNNRPKPHAQLFRLGLIPDKTRH
jgi:hypothetical protein